MVGNTGRSIAALLSEKGKGITMKKEVRLLSALLAAVLLTAAGCSQASESGDASGGSIPSGSTSSPGTSPSEEITFAEGVDPEDYRGTTVRFATWKDPANGEDGAVVEAFQKKYGINVKIDLIPQNQYSLTIAGNIAAENSPDIFFDNEFFPSSLSVLQPIDAMKLNLEDPIWDKGMLERSTIQEKTYLVNTVGNIWNEADLVFYNKKLLEDNNITTPEEYYAAGKWSFDGMRRVMMQVKELGSGYVGGYLDVETLLGSTGSSFYRFEDKQFVNGIDDQLIQVMQYMSQAIKDGLVRGAGYDYRDEFKNGKVGIAMTNAYGLKKNGYWQGMNPDHIGFTFLPDWDENTKAKQTGIFRGWGLIKGASNPVAAGIFLRYYLDVNQYDISSAFLNADAESMFFQLTAMDTADKFSGMLLGTTMILGEDRFDYWNIASVDPAQIQQQLRTRMGAVDAGVERLNAYLKEQTEQE